MRSRGRRTTADIRDMLSSENENGSAVFHPVLPPGPPGIAARLRDRRRMRRRWVATLTLLVLLLSSAAVVKVPELQQARLNENESAVIAALKNISSAQSQMQASGLIDRDRNGSGEYAFFAELAGAVPLRGTSARCAPAVLSAAFGTLRQSRVHRGGYVFQMFLPDRDGQGIAEDPSGGDVGCDNGIDAEMAETLWCCYAWPDRAGASGNRAFFVNQSGDVLATNCRGRGYDGERSSCAFDAAFAASAAGGMLSPVAANTVGRDGNIWVVV